MESKFWHDVWAEGNIGFNQTAYNKNLVKYIELLENHSHNILVPLCGKSIDMKLLCEKGFKVTGVEIVKEAIEQYLIEHNLSYDVLKINDKFTQYQSKKKNLCLYHGDFFGFDQINSKFEAIYDRASMIALPPMMRANHAKMLSKLTLSNGRIILITLEYDQSKVSGPPHSVCTEEVKSLFEKDFKIKILSEETTKNIGPKFKNSGIHSVKQKVYFLHKLK